MGVYCDLIVGLICIFMCFMAIFIYSFLNCASDIFFYAKISKRTYSNITGERRESRQ